ncbi:MAG: ThuA domain-containing protein [Chloroflexi bacterium OHK40]
MRKALIIWGGWEGHRPAEWAAHFAGLLRDEGFTVEVSDTLQRLADPASLADLDLIVPYWTMGTLDAALEANVLSAVAGGVGIAGCHGGMADSFRNNTNYQFMVGGQWVAHPGNIITYRVQIRDREDPVTAGLDDFTVRSEQYYMHVDPSNHVLATTTFDGSIHPWIAGTVMPVVWKRRWGEGRVFYTSVGHAPEEFHIPEFREIMRRGMRWASRG